MSKDTPATPSPFPPINPEVMQLLQENLEACSRMAYKLRGLADEIKLFADAFEGRAASLMLNHPEYNQEPVAYKPLDAEDETQGE